MKRTLTFLLLVAAVLGAQAQQTVGGTLQGGDQRPLPYANIALMRQADSTFLRGTTSDDRGRFSLQADTFATFLRISAIGYETLFVPVADSTGAQALNLGILRLREGATTLNEVSVTAAKPMYSVDGEKTLYNVSEDPSVQTGTASDALQNAPGVQVDVQGNITLDGQSVDVWINDRPSHLSGESLRQYIKQLPANSISSIEVIKNPSAKYGGGGPVINIKTDQKVMRNSYVSFGANGSSQPALVPWLSYVYSNEKFRISAYLSYRRYTYESSSRGEGTMLDSIGDPARQWSSTGSGENTGNSFNANLNFSYEFDTMNSLSGWFYTYPNWSSGRSDGRNVRTDYIGGAAHDYSYTSHSDSDDRNSGGGGGMWFQHKFDNKGHQLSASLNGNWFAFGGGASRFEHYDAQPRLSFDERTDGAYLSGSGSIGVDYSLPYSEQGEVEAGIGFGFSAGHDYDLRDTLDAAGNYRRDLLRSDSSRTASQEVGAYLSWRRKWGNFTLKVGSRLHFEHDAISHLTAPDCDTAVNQLSLRPSLHLSYRTESMHTFSLGYSINTSHPSASSLSRYISYSTDSYSTGNPLLEASYTHNLNADWNKYFASLGSIGASATFRANINERNTISDPQWSDFFGRYVPVSMPHNASDSRRFDFNVNAMLRPTAFLNIRLSPSLTDSWYRVMVRPGSWVEDHRTSWGISGRVWAKLWNRLEVFVSGRYRSRGHGWSVLDISEPYKSLDLGLSADFFDRRLSLYLNVDDIFDWNEWGSSSLNPYYTSSSTSKYTSRYVTFGLTLRFGKMELADRSREGIQSGGGHSGQGAQ